MKEKGQYDVIKVPLMLGNFEIFYQTLYTLSMYTELRNIMIMIINYNKEVNLYLLSYPIYVLCF